MRFFVLARCGREIDEGGDRRSAALAVVAVAAQIDRRRRRGRSQREQRAHALIHSSSSNFLKFILVGEPAPSFLEPP